MKGDDEYETNVGVHCMDIIQETKIYLSLAVDLNGTEISTRISVDEETDFMQENFYGDRDVDKETNYESCYGHATHWWLDTVCFLDIPKDVLLTIALYRLLYLYHTSNMPIFFSVAAT